MKRSACLFLGTLVAVLSLAASCAAAEEAMPAAPGKAFVFDNGVTWDASAEDMLKAEKVYESGKYRLTVSGGVSIYSIDHSPTYERHVWLSCTFFGGELAIIGAYFVGETAADYAAHLDRLTERYGEPTESDVDRLNAMFKPVFQNRNISTRKPAFDGWLLPDGTRVYLLLDAHLYEYYMNEAVILRMNEEAR